MSSSLSVHGWLAVIGVITCALLRVSVATGEEFAPHSHQLDVEIANLSSFVADTSLVRVREHNIAGTRFHLAQDLGMQTMQIPRVLLTYWFNELNAVQVQLRYFEAGGSHGLPQSANYNGVTLAPRQRLHTGDTIWFDGAVYYERRLTPLVQKYLDRFSLVKELDLRAKIGLEYTYLDFRLNNGKARVTPTSKGEESAEDFYRQELPMPTIGLELYQRLNEHVAFALTLKGNWINHWDSLRPEGGPVYTSKWGVETHWHSLYTNPAWL